MELMQIINGYNVDYRMLIAFSFLYLLLFSVAELTYHFYKVKVEYTRKVVHVCTGLIALLFPIFIPNVIDLLILCGSFIGIVFMTKKWKLLPSINAIERTSLGSVLFPVVVIICYLVEGYMQNYAYFLIPILILTLADPMAALVGRKWPKGKYSICGNKKTIVGTTAFVVTAFLSSLSAFHFLDASYNHNGILFSLSIAIFAAIGEAMSVRGYDNLMIPLCCIGTLLLFQF